MENSWNAQLLRLSQQVGKSQIISLFHMSPPSLLLCSVLGLSQDEIVRASESGSAQVFSFFLATVTTCLLWRVLLCKVRWSWWIIMFQGLNCSKTILWFERFDKHKNRNTSFKTEKPNGSSSSIWHCLEWNDSILIQPARVTVQLSSLKQATVENAVPSPPW